MFDRHSRYRDVEDRTYVTADGREVVYKARRLLPAALIGLAFAALHGLYLFARLDRVTITSKLVQFNPLALVSTFLLVSCGAFFFLNALSWRGRSL